MRNKTERSFIELAVSILQDLREAGDLDPAKVAETNTVPTPVHLALQDQFGFRDGHGIRRALIALCRQDSGKDAYSFLPGKL
jgi:hypothetical protein